MNQLVSHRYGVEGVGISMQGGRTENQDDMGCLETPIGFLVVVCDGMGGGPAGKTASYISKSTVLGVFEQCSEMASPYDVIKMAIDRANSAINERIMMMPELEGMGSTIVLLLINEKSAFVAHLGDSRCYQIRNGKSVFRTKDHSLVGELVRSGALTEEQARTSSQSNIITRGIGSTKNHVAEIEEVPYRRGDRFVLCTDGVWGIMPQSDLMIRLTKKQDLSSLVRNLSTEIDQIGFSHGNHHDNHTLAILEMNNNSILNVRMNKKTKSILYLGAILLGISVVFNIVSFLNFGAIPQIEALRSSNDSLTDVTIQLSEILEERNKEIDRLVALNKGLESTISVGQNESQQEMARLHHSVDSLSAKIDSLTKENKKLQETQAQTQAPQKKVKTQKQNTTTNTAKTNSPVEQLNSCIEDLRYIASVKKTKETDASKEIWSFVYKSIELLSAFNASTNNKYSETINPILTNLNEDEKFRESKNVQESKDRGHKIYRVRKETKQEIDEIVWKLKELKDSISKKGQ